MIFNVCNCPACPCRDDVDDRDEVCLSCRLGLHAAEEPPVVEVAAIDRAGIQAFLKESIAAHRAEGLSWEQIAAYYHATPERMREIADEPVMEGAGLAWECTTCGASYTKGSPHACGFPEIPS